MDYVYGEYRVEINNIFIGFTHEFTVDINSTNTLRKVKFSVLYNSPTIINCLRNSNYIFHLLIKGDKEIINGHFKIIPKDISVFSYKDYITPYYSFTCYEIEKIETKNISDKIPPIIKTKIKKEIKLITRKLTIVKKIKE